MDSHDNITGVVHQLSADVRAGRLSASEESGLAARYTIKLDLYKKQIYAEILRIGDQINRLRGEYQTLPAFFDFSTDQGLQRASYVNVKSREQCLLWDMQLWCITISWYIGEVDEWLNDEVLWLNRRDELVKQIRRLLPRGRTCRYEWRYGIEPLLLILREGVICAERFLMKWG